MSLRLLECFRIDRLRMSITKKNSITIRNFRRLPTNSPESIQEKWTFLETEVVEILTSLRYQKSLEHLYRLAHELYCENFPPLLYNLQVVIETYLTQKLEDILKEDGILSTIDVFWKEFCRQVRTIKNIFLYFDRSPKFFKYNNVQTISMNLFSKIIVQNLIVSKKIVERILEEIYLERIGNSIDQNLLKSSIDMMNVLQVYEDIFQGDLFKASQVFYEQEGNSLLQNMEVPQYLLHVNKRILEEQERVRNYLNKNSENNILDILHKQLVENHIPEILDKGFDDLLNNKMYDELILIYKLFQRVSNGCKYLVAYFKEFILKKGQTIINNQNEKTMIQDLLDFKDYIEKIIRMCFENQKDFHESVRVSFKNFMNNNSKTSQLLAKYLDVKLRCKDINDEDLEAILGKIIKIFKYVQGKDIFEAFYKKHLAKRLLLGKSASHDAENSMISKLKEECGSAFTSNIEGMFQDINISGTINTSFKQINKIHENGFVADFTVNVLTSSCWPNYPSFNVNLPCELITYQQNFQKFYLGNHSGRKLLWQPNLGHCLLRASFDCGLKELQVSLFQTIVLLLFNFTSEIGYKEIRELTNMDELELKKTLLSLACGKARVLVKNPKGKDIDENDTFTFNNRFTDKLFRVRINQVQLQESPEEEQETEKNVLVDRQFQIDAAIVRVMKQKKSITHNMLVKELYNILDIPVNQSDLKKRIELLIEREYMERDKENKSNYIYIA